MTLSTNGQKNEMRVAFTSAAEAEARVLILNEKYTSYLAKYSTVKLIADSHRIIELSQDLSHRIDQLDAARSQRHEYVLSTYSDIYHRWETELFCEGANLCFVGALLQSNFLYYDINVSRIEMKPCSRRSRKRMLPSDPPSARLKHRKKALIYSCGSCS